MNSPEFSLGEEVTEGSPSDGLSPEQGETVSNSFPVLLVLGGGWAKTPDSQPHSALVLSRESRMRVKAAGEMLEQKVVGNIILSGGKTAGKNSPSEAQAMKDYLQKKYPQIPDDNIILEDKSMDTSENIENVDSLLEEKGFSEAILLTSGTHLERAKQLAENYGLNITDSYSAEDKIKKRTPARYKKFMELYTATSEYKATQVKEFILRSLLIVDRKGKIPRFIAHQTRNK